MSRCAWLAAVLTVPLALPAQAGTVVLDGATVHPVSGPVIERGTVVVIDGIIEAVGDDVPVPLEAERVSLDGQHLYPGLINMSTLLGLFEIRDARATRDDRELGAINPNLRGAVALNPSSALLPVARADGVLSFLTYPVGGTIAGTAVLAYAGSGTAEDLVIREPVALVVNWPRMGYDWSENEEIGYETVQRIDRAFDAATDYAALRETGSDIAPDVRWDALSALVAADTPVLVRASDGGRIRAALDWAEARNVDIVFEGYRGYTPFADELAARDVPVILTAAHMTLPRNDQPYDAVYAQAATLHAAGVRIAFATGMSPYGTYNARQLPDLAGVSVGFGLPREAAVRALTLSAAEIAGVAERLGSIEVGKEATLIATDGDVLEIRTHVTGAWIAGEEVSLDNRHRQLYEAYRKPR